MILKHGRLRALLLLALMAGLLPSPARADQAANPDAVAAEREAGRQLQAKLKEALRQGAPRLVVPPGRYRLTPETPDVAHLAFRNVSNFELAADGVTLICETKNSALFLDHCSHVTLHGLTVDYDPLPMTQGVITAVSPHGLDFKIDAGYDAPDYDGKGVPQIWVADGATRQVRPGSMNYGSPKEIVPIGEGTYRLVTRGERHDTVREGDIIKIPQKLNLKSPHAVRLDACQAVTLQDVTIESAPCFGFVSTWGDDIVLDRVRVIPGPPPPGATEARIFSSSADGINLQDNRHGPVIRRCVVACNGDDGIAVYNACDVVLGVQDGQTVLMGLREPDPGKEAYTPGDTLRFFLLQEHRTEERKIVSVEPVPNPPDPEKIAGKPRYARAVRVVLDAPLAAAPGDDVLNTQYAGRGFDISNNVLVNNASRGITVSQSYGSVTHNSIFHSFLPAIHITAGSKFQTCVEIRDNVIADADIGFPQRKNWQGAISVVAGDTVARFLDGNSAITIAGNVINQANGVGIHVMSGSKITIEDNVFGALGTSGNPNQGSHPPPILLEQVAGASVNRNIVAGPGWQTPGSPVQTARDCTDISVDPPAP